MWNERGKKGKKTKEKLCTGWRKKSITYENIWKHIMSGGTNINQPHCNRERLWSSCVFGREHNSKNHVSKEKKKHINKRTLTMCIIFSDLAQHKLLF